MYALFAGQFFEPSGGWADHKKTSCDLSLLKIQAEIEVADDVDWWHIIDLKTGEIVEQWKTTIYKDRSHPLSDYDAKGHGVEPLF